MPEIEWKVTEQNVTQELVSTDNRWHISKKQEGTKEPGFFMTNYDLLLTPHGTGTDYRECFETFMQRCDEYEKLLAKVRDEAKEHLDALLKAEAQLKHEN